MCFKTSLKTENGKLLNFETAQHSSNLILHFKILAQSFYMCNEQLVKMINYLRPGGSDQHRRGECGSGGIWRCAMGSQR